VYASRSLTLCVPVCCLRALATAVQPLGWQSEAAEARVRAADAWTQTHAVAAIAAARRSLLLDYEVPAADLALYAAATQYVPVRPRRCRPLCGCGCACVYVPVPVPVSMSVCMCMCMCICLCVCAHVHA
jgi:hypothetical protein